MKKVVSGLIAGAFFLGNALLSNFQTVNAAPYSKFGTPNDTFKNAVNPLKGKYSLTYNSKGIVFDDDAKTDLYLFDGVFTFSEILETKLINDNVYYDYGRIMQSEPYFTQIKIDGKIYNFSENYDCYYDHYEFDYESESLHEYFKFPGLDVERQFTLVDDGTTVEIQYKVDSAEKKSVGMVVPITYTDKDAYKFGAVNIYVPEYGIVENEADFSGDDVPDDFISLYSERGYHDSVSSPRRSKDIHKYYPVDRISFADTGRLYEKDPYLTDDSGSCLYDISSVTARENNKINDAVTALYIWDEKERDFSESNIFTIYVGLLDNPLGVNLNGDYFADISDGQNKTLHFRFDMKNIFQDYENTSWIEYDIPEGMRMKQNTAESQKYSPCFDLTVPGTYAPGNYPVTFRIRMMGTTEKVIRRYITITDTPGRDNRVIFNDDVFPFLNSKMHFARSACYYPDQNLYEQLLINMSNKVKTRLFKETYTQWNGSCFGMSAAISLYKTGYMHPSLWESDALVPNDMKAHGLVNSVFEMFAPTNTIALANYYQLLQYYPDVEEYFSDYFSVASIKDGGVDNSYALKQLVKEAGKVKKGGFPVLTSFAWAKSGITDNDWTAHAIVIYDCVEADPGFNKYPDDGRTYKYMLPAYDPNSPIELYFFVTEDYSDWYYVSNGLNPMKCQKNSKGIDKRFVYPPISSIDLLDQKNAETGIKYNLLNDYTRTSLRIDSDEIIVRSSSGNEFRTDGMNSSGNLDAFAYISPFAEITEDDNGNSAFSAYPTVIFSDINDVYTVSSSKENGGLKGTMTYQNYMFDFNTGSADSVVFEPSGGVSIKGNSGEYELGIVCEEKYMKTPWFSLNARGESSDTVYMHMTADGIMLESDNMNNTQIYASDSYNSVELSFSSEEKSVLLKAVDDKTLGVYSDPDGDNIYDTLVAEQTQKKIVFETETIHAENLSKNYIPGDADGNGVVNSVDIIYIISCILNPEENNSISFENTDLNFDKKIDIKDLILVKKIL